MRYVPITTILLLAFCGGKPTEAESDRSYKNIANENAFTMRIIDSSYDEALSAGFMEEKKDAFRGLPVDLSAIAHTLQIPENKNVLIHMQRRHRDTLHPYGFLVVGPPEINCKQLAGPPTIRPSPYGAEGTYVLDIKFTPDGAKKFYQFTKDNNGNRTAIVIGERVVATPNIREPIPSATAVIHGDFTQEIARDIKNGIAACWE